MPQQSPPPPAPPEPGYLRVAAVQIDYLPATEGALDDPFWEPGKPHSLKPNSGVWPGVVHSRFNDLRTRVTQRYLEWHLSRLRSVLESCRASQVHAVVLPEYSVPHQILPDLASMGREHDLVIVAGTHSVTQAGLRSIVYGNLGCDPPSLNAAVCPVLSQGRIVQLIPKLHRSQWEPHLSPGSSWEPVELPEPVGVMGVLICLDFLHSQSPEWRAQVGPRIDDCRWIAVPSFTPALTAAKEFPARGAEQSERYKRPVVHANRARDGGSRVYADSERTDVRPMPLQAGVEGVLIVDIDTTMRLPGSHTPYEFRSAVSPVTTPTIVYCMEEREHSEWVANWATELTRDGNDAEHLMALDEWLERNPPDLNTKVSARIQRLGMLMQEKGRWTSLEELRRLTYEVLTDAKTLSFEVFTAALAQGAADEIESWRERFDAGFMIEVDAVVSRLNVGALAALRRVPEQARPVFYEVVRAVRGSAAGVAPVMRLAFEGPDQDIDTARRLVATGDFEAALRLLDARVLQLENVIKSKPDELELSERLVRARLALAAAALNLGEEALARREMERVDHSSLTPQRRLALAELWGGLGDSAKARAILPTPEECISDDDLHRRSVVEQSIEVFEGRDLTDAPASAIVAARLALVHLKRGDLGDCVRLATLTLDGTNDVLESSVAVDLLLKSLLYSADASPWFVQPIPEPDRRHLVERLERAFASLDGSELAGAARRRLAELEWTFRSFISDTDWLSTREPPNGGEVAQFQRAEQLARSGDVASAMDQVPKDDHPWSRDVFHTELMALAGSLPDAVELLDALRRLFPRRARIEGLYSSLCERLGRFDDALDAARAAADALPGVGQILRVAQLLAGQNRYQEALDALAPLSEDARPQVLFARARLLDLTGDVAEAERCHVLYLEQRPEDGTARIFFARHLYAQNRRQQAAHEAWTAFKQSDRPLPIADLLFVGHTQAPSGDVDPEGASRIREVVKRLEVRRAAEPAAEGARMSLLMRLPSAATEDAPSPIDFDLLEKLGAVQRVSSDEVVNLILEQPRIADLGARAYRTGHLALLASLKLRNLRLPEYVVRSHDSRSDSTGFICPAFDLQSQTILELAGTELVVTQLELTLLVHFGLVDDVRMLLGEAGRLVLPDVDRAAILLDAHELSIRVVDSWSRRVDAAIAGLPDGTTVHDGALVDGSESRIELDTANFAAWLCRIGIISLEQIESLEGDRTLDSTRLDDFGTPSAVSLGLDVITKLERARILKGVVASLQDMRVGVHVSQEVRQWLERERKEEALRAEGCELANRVHDCLARGLEGRWIALDSLPNTSDAPALRDSVPSRFDQLFAQPLRRALALARLVNGNVRRRLNAEFFATLAPVSRDAVLGFAWRDPQHYLSLAEELRRATQRDIHLPALVRVAVNEPVRRRNVLEGLAELGFPDALNAGDILDLAERLEGALHAPRARALLHRVEWVAREPAHAGAPLAAIHIAYAYADAIFSVWCGSDGATPRSWSDTRKTALIGSLLSRLEAIELVTQRDLLVNAFERTALMAISAPEASWRGSPNSSYVLDPESHGARMWTAFWAWVETSQSRRASYSRALRSAWLWIDKQAKKPSVLTLHAMTLWHAVSPMVHELSPGDFFAPPALEALAILSSCWNADAKVLRSRGFQWIPQRDGGEPPARDVELTAEQLLQRGAGVLGRRNDLVGDISRVEFPVLSDDGEVVARLAAPIEALLLRAESHQVDIVPGIARQWATLQGIHDGVAYRRLQALAAGPSKSKVRRALARHTVSSLWRIVRHDPTYLLRWPEALYTSGRSTEKLKALCGMLSEPMDGLPDGPDVWRILVDRFENGDWKERDDRVELVLFAGSIPGGTAVGAARSLLESSDVNERVIAAFERLQTHTEQPIGQLAIDVILLRTAAARKDPLVTGDREFDLARELPDALARLVNSLDGANTELDAPEPHQMQDGVITPDVKERSVSELTLAVAEGALLRTCLSTIERVGPALSSRSRLWLGWRLYGWFALQLEDMRRDGRVRARQDALERLVQSAPPLGGPLRDPHDPFGFDPSAYNHRLAAVLHAIAIGSAMAQVTEGKLSDGTIPIWSSSSLEDALIRIANRFADPGPQRDLLNWRAPANLPDLATWAVLALNSKGFARLEAEARLRALTRVPVRDSDTSPHGGTFAAAVLYGAMLAVGNLGEEERHVLKEKVQADSEQATRWRLPVLTTLYATGEEHLQSDVEELLVERAAAANGDDNTPRMVALYLSKELPENLPTASARLMARLRERDVSSVLVLVGLARLSINGSPEQRAASRRHLMELAEQEPFRGNGDVLELLNALGGGASVT